MEDTQERVVAGRYRLVEPLGSGGMGTVWRAEDLVLGRSVAVKEVSFPHGLSDEDRDVLRERTRREARAAAKLDHPSAVTVYDVVEDDGAPYLVMELVEAHTLSQAVRSDGPLGPQRTAAIGLALLGALEAAHRQGIVHRDVKPGNVLLGEGDRVVLTDFGIASSAGDSSITHTGLLLGSPSYIAPERARGQAPGPASDLWSLGATLFTAVEGQPPYDGGEPLLTVTAVVTGEHAPFVHAGPLVPVLEGLLERDPARRMTAGAARRHLQQVVASAPVRPEPATTTALPVAVPKPTAERTTALPLREVREAAEPTAAPREPGWSRPPRVTPSRRRSSPAPFLLLALVLAVAGVVVAVVLATDPLRGGIQAQLPGREAPAEQGDGDANAPEDEAGAEDADGDAPAEGDPAGPVDPPEGWQAITGDVGWTGAVPPTYAQSSFGGKPQYKDESTGRTLRVSTTAPGGGKPDAVQDREEQAAFFKDNREAYEEIDISRADYRGYEAADWEFTYRSGGADLHVINRVFVVDGRGYSLFFQTRASDDWAAAREDFDQIAASFQPA